MKRYYIYILMVAMALSACSSKEEPIIPSNDTISIFARVAEPMVTKTIVDESSSHDHSQGRTYLLWNNDDEIGVFAKTTANAKFSTKLSSGQTAGIADFNGTLAAGEVPEYAYYPYSNKGTDLTKIPGSIPSTQVFDSENRRIPADYKIGGLSKIIKDGETVKGYEFYFTNILSLFCIGVDATGTKLEGETLKSVKLTFPTTAVANGEFTVNLQTRAINLTGSATQNVMELNLTGNARTLSKNTQIIGYMSCAPFSAKGQNVTINVGTDKGESYTFTTTLKTDFAPGFIYHFPITLNKYTENTPE